MKPVGRLGADQAFERHLVRMPEGTGLARLGVLYRPRALAAGGAVTRFVNAARHAASVHHDNLEPVLAVDQSSGPVVVAAVCPGETFAQLLGGQRVPAAVAVALVAQAAAGLAALHARGLVHGAISPNYLCVSYQGQVRLMGAAALAGAATIGVAPPGDVYLPEEPPSPGRDVWSLAAVLHALIVGEAPAPGAGASSMLPPAVGELVGRCLGSLGARPHNGGELAAALTGMLAAAGAPDALGIAEWLRGRAPRRATAWRRLRMALESESLDPRLPRLAALLLSGRPLPPRREAEVSASPPPRRAASDTALSLEPPVADPPIVVGGAPDLGATLVDQAPTERATAPDLHLDPRLSAAAPAGISSLRLPEQPVGRPAAIPLSVPPDGYEPRLWDAEDDAPDMYRPVPELRDPVELLKAPAKAGGDPGSALVLEVARLRGATISESVVVRVGGRYPSRRPFVRMTAGGARLTPPGGAEGSLTHLGVSDPLPEAGGLLEAGDSVDMRLGADRYLLRVDHGAREAGRATGVRRPWGVVITSLGLAIGLHLLLVGGVVSLGALGVQMTVASQAEPERFASLEELKALPPPPPRPKPKPKPLPKPTAEPAEQARPADPAEARPSLPKSVRAKMSRRRAAARDEVEALKAALEPGGADDRETVEKVVRGMDALPGKGSSNAFEVANLGAGPAGAPIDAGGNGGTRVRTRGEAAARKGAGRLKEARRGGAIRAKVKNVRALTKVACSVDRSAVRSAVDARTGRITGCYERALMKRADLSGKITVEWEITPQGSVQGARVRLSTLGDPEVGTCVLGVIRKIKFPKPSEPGSCVISYPFIFSSSR